MLEFFKESLIDLKDKTDMIQLAYPSWNGNITYLNYQLQDQLYLEEIKDKLDVLSWQKVYYEHYKEQPHQVLIVQLKPELMGLPKIEAQENLIKRRLEKYANMNYEINYNKELNQLYYKLPKISSAFNLHCCFLLNLRFVASLTIRNLDYLNQETLSRLQKNIVSRLEQHLGADLNALYLILASSLNL